VTLIVDLLVQYAQAVGLDGSEIHAHRDVTDHAVLNVLAVSRDNANNRVVSTVEALGQNVVDIVGLSESQNHVQGLWRGKKID
jgi:hypothetical protein